MKSNVHFKPAKLHKTREGWYIEYSYYSTLEVRLKRKRVWLNNIPYHKRKIYADNLIKSLNDRLSEGWSPEVEFLKNLEAKSIPEGIALFLEIKKKELRPASLKTYSVNAKIILEFLRERHLFKIRISEFTKSLAVDLLNFLYLEKEWSTVRYNRFLSFAVSLWNFFIEQQFLKDNVFKGFKKKKEQTKIRQLFSEEQLDIYFHYLEENDKWFLLYSYLTFYCFIRPKEITFLKVKHFNLKNMTLVIDGSFSKNGKRQNVTLPRKLTALLYELKVNELPKEWFIYSAGHRPGTVWRDPRKIAKKFARIRKRLELPLYLQFYSLKDTGIVKMLQAGIPPNVVRDQARHYSLEVTNRYVLMANEGKANSLILDGVNY